jgi:hypothetical protein
MTTIQTVLDTFNFRFKKDKFGNKRASVELKLPVPSADGLSEIIVAGGNGLQLLQDIVYDFIKATASEIVSADENISQENFPVERLDWQAIANMPKAERATISAEQWEAFATDYLQVMPGLTGKTADQVGLAASLFVTKLTKVKTNKPVLEKLNQQLAIYVDNSPNAENFSDVIGLLTRRLQSYLSAEEPQILETNL